MDVENRRVVRARAKAEIGDEDGPEMIPPGGSSMLSGDYVEYSSRTDTCYTPIIVLTGIFGALFIILPLAIRKGPNKGILRCCIMLSLFCIWIFWVTIYISQMNPIMGPRMRNTSLAWIAHKEGDLVTPPQNPPEANPPGDKPQGPNSQEENPSGDNPSGDNLPGDNDPKVDPPQDNSDSKLL